MSWFWLFSLQIGRIKTSRAEGYVVWLLLFSLSACRGPGEQQVCPSPRRLQSQGQQLQAQRAGGGCGRAPAPRLGQLQGGTAGSVPAQWQWHPTLPLLCWQPGAQLPRATLQHTRWQGMIARVCTCNHLLEFPSSVSSCHDLLNRFYSNYQITSPFPYYSLKDMSFWFCSLPKFSLLSAFFQCLQM